MGKAFEIRHVHSGLGKFRRERPQKARAIMDKAAQVIESTQKRLCPVDTGALRDSIHIENRGTFEIAIVEGSETVNYGFFIEYGTRRMAAQPHIRPAAIEGMKYIDEALRKLAREPV